MSLSKEKAESVKQGFDLALLALGILPSVFAAGANLYNKLAKGEAVTEEELENLVSRVQERSNTIQGS